jgi:hypothetical protein
LAPFGMLSDQKQFPTVWVCACTKGCRKVYEKKGSGWSAIMDHLAKVHGIEKDTKHPTSISSQQKKTRAECKTRALDGGMTQTRFQAICTTRYIIRRLLPFSHVECPEFRLCAVKVRPPDPPRPSIGGRNLFFFLLRLSLNPHPSSVADGVGGQNPPSVIRNVRYGKMT